VVVPRYTNSGVRMGREKTVKLTKKEYRSLAQAKRKLEDDLGVQLAFGSTIAFLAGILLGRIATKSKQYLGCQCGNIIDVTGLPRSFSCPKCGLTYLRTDKKSMS